MKKLHRLQKKIVMIKMLFMDGGGKAKYLKKKKIFAGFGYNVKYQTNFLPAEPYLVKIHDNVRIAAGVKLITHDVIDGMLALCPKYKKDLNSFRFHMGTIEIFDNCMIGADAIVLPNVKIGPNAIVGAGAVITKDVLEGTIVAGNPAKVIGKFDDYAQKRINAPKLATNNDSIEEIIKDYWGD